MKKHLMFIALIVTMLLITSCVPQPSKTNASPDNKSSTNSSQESEKTSSEIKDTALKKGEMSTIDDWEITLDSFETKNKISLGAIAYTPDEGNLYLETIITIKNTGKELATFLPTYAIGKAIRCRIMYQGEYEYTASTLYGYDNDMHDDSLNPLTTVSGSIVFSIPSDIAKSDELVLEFSKGSKKVLYELK